MRPEILKIVFLKELRELLRDRRSLAVMFGIPLLLYPIMTIVTASMGSARQKELNDKPGRVAVVNSQAAPQLIKQMQDKDSGVEIVPTFDAGQALRDTTVDAVVRLPVDLESKALNGLAIDQIRTDIDRSRTTSTYAEKKLKKVLDAYEQWIIQQRLARHGVSANLLNPLDRDTTDVSTGDQRLGNLMGMLLPLLLLITGMLGALFPALSATTTERELGTLETLLVSPAGRVELLVAKGLLVLLCAMLTAGLNLLSMSLVMWRTFSALEKTMGTMSLSASSLLLSYVAIVPSLILFTAIVLIVGMIARNFREANSFATPLMLLPTTSLIVSIIEPKVSVGLLLTPVINTSLIIKQVLIGRATFGAFALAWISSLVYAGLILGVAARLFSSEQLVNPSWEPVSFRCLRRGKGPFRRRLPAPDAAIALFAFSLLLTFYVQPSLQSWGLLPMIGITEIFLVAGPALLIAWLVRYDWKQTFSLRRPALKDLQAAVLLGVGLAICVGLLNWLQCLFWPADPELGRIMTQLFEPALHNHPILTVASIGILAGVCEELLFRGPIQAGLLRRLPVWFALCLGAALFSLAHLDLHGAPLRFLLGLILAYVVWRGGSIYPAMIIHGVYDSFQIGAAAVLKYWPGVGKFVGLSPLTGEMLNAASFIRLAFGIAFSILGWKMLRTSWQARPTLDPIPLPLEQSAASPARRIPA